MVILSGSAAILVHDAPQASFDGSTEFVEGRLFLLRLPKREHLRSSAPLLLLSSPPLPDLTSCQPYDINFIISDIQVFDLIPHRESARRSQGQQGEDTVRTKPPGG